MKRIYFVRHGQTLKNTQSIHQGPEEPLTETGKAQAREVAEKLAGYGIDTLFASPYTRAIETAAIIGEHCDVPLIETESLKEFRRPDPLYGKSHYSLGSLEYIWSLYWHRDDPQWNNHGAENMFAIRNRILDARRALCAAEGERVVAVSHAIFIDMFVQAVCADRSLSFKEFVGGLFGAKKLPNTGIVAFDVDDTAPPETCNWWLVEGETSIDYLRYR